MQRWLALPGTWLKALLASRPITAIARSNALTTLLLVAVVVFWSFPSYDVAVSLHETDTTWHGVLVQIDGPFVDHTASYPPESHSAKLGFRFVPAVILGALGVHSITGALVFQFFTLILFYVLLVQVLDRLFNKDRMLVLGLALPICFVIAGHVYASDFRGIFDTLALDFLLMGILWRRSPLVIIPLLLGYFTDERALIASGTLILLDLFLADRHTSLGVMLQGLRSRAVIRVLASWVLYGIIRAALAHFCHLTSAPVDMAQYIAGNAGSLFSALYIGWEGMLIPLVIVTAALWRMGARAFTLAMYLSLAASYIVALSVIDVDRSMAYILPLLILVLVIWQRTVPRERLFLVLGWVVLVSLVYDHYYPLPAQLYRMHSITHTI